MSRCTISSPLLYTLLLLILVLINRAGAVYNPSHAPFGGQAGSLPVLFPRQAVCTDDPSSVSCGVGGFCCPTDTRCIPVESNTSVVCCKTGEFCDEIFPIPCTSSSLTTKNVTCGTQCCPAGYECGEGEDRCIMKAENLPADHVANREGRKNATDEALREQCQSFLNLPATDGDDEDGVTQKCSKITFEGILIGLFPGIAIGFATMLAYIKFVEIKTRRRTIHFNGRLSASPDDLSYMDQKPPPVPRIQENIAAAYSPNPTERSISPAPPFQREWKSRGPTDFSPNLGPTIAPRERSTSRDGRGSAISRSTAASSSSPAPQPLSAAPSKPRPVRTLTSRVSAESTASVTESDFSAAVSQTMRSGGHRSHGRIDETSDDEDGFSEVVIMDGTRGRGRNRVSAETGYTASFYQGGEGLSQPPFVEEEEVPPLRYGYGSPPRLPGGGTVKTGLGWDNNRF